MKSRKLALSVFASTLFLSSVSVARIAPQAEVAAAVSNWTGYYGGFNVGAVNNTTNITDNQAVYFHSTIQQVANPQLTAGLQVGYRRQMDLSHTTGVYGVEFSTHFSNATFNKQYGSPFALYQLNSSTALQNTTLLQLTGGIAAENTLLFLAVGLSWTDMTGSMINPAGVPFSNAFSLNQKTYGTAVGGGIEYAITKTISARFKIDVIKPTVSSTTDNGGNSYQIAESIVQSAFGINYKFA